MRSRGVGVIWSSEGFEARVGEGRGGLKDKMFDKRRCSVKCLFRRTSRANVCTRTACSIIRS